METIKFNSKKRVRLNLKKCTFVQHETVMALFTDFILDSSSGRRLRKDGKKISHGTVTNYTYTYNLLRKFCHHSNFKLRIYVYNNLNSVQRSSATRYYIKFYQKLTHYLYKELGHFDNYVGATIKNIKSFFNYLEFDRDLSFGPFTKYFHVPKEEIPIIALRPDQLQYIIHSRDFENKLPKDLMPIKDIFVFGCTVALRVSDLLSLTVRNLEVRNGVYHLKVKSKKTAVSTSIKLPPYAAEIIDKYKNQYNTLLPTISKAWLNNRLKAMAQYLPEDFQFPKVRERKGKAIVIYKDKDTKKHFHLSDHICTHTMRRTGITSLLLLGMSEHLVRQISGHAPNSKEFYRYVHLTQDFMDRETEKAFDKLCSWNPYKPNSIMLN